jgi:REP element-mobilizing transposase RayT
MPQQVRIEFEGAIYHVMARGNQRNRIFASPDGGDESLFLETLGECCERSGFRIWAWVLIGRHYHILIETPSANPFAGSRAIKGAPGNAGAGRPVGAHGTGRSPPRRGAWTDLSTAVGP